MKGDTEVRLGSGCGGYYVEVIDPAGRVLWEGRRHEAEQLAFDLLDAALGPLAFRGIETVLVQGGAL